MKLNKPFMLPAVLGAEASAAEDENHWMLPLQFRKLPAFSGVIGKLIAGQDSPWNNVRSHMKTTFLVETDDPQRKEPTRPRTNAAISSAAVSNTK